MRPQLGILPRQADELRAQLATFNRATVGASSLTTAELRLIPLLSTHLTFPEIGERLFISRHTVKTQALSIYRKLGASSRGEAIERAQQIGLATATAYRDVVADAHAAGATADEVVDTLCAVAPVVGSARVVSAAPGLALAAGYDVDAALERSDAR
jgi:DNA-binding CsgD family transcriptional regulator